MADAVVDRDAAWEGDALLHLLVLLERLKVLILFMINDRTSLK